MQHKAHASFVYGLPIFKCNLMLHCLHNKIGLELDHLALFLLISARAFLASILLDLQLGSAHSSLSSTILVVLAFCGNWVWSVSHRNPPSQGRQKNLCPSCTMSLSGVGACQISDKKSESFRSIHQGWQSDTNTEIKLSSKILGTFKK